MLLEVDAGTMLMWSRQETAAAEYATRAAQRQVAELEEEIRGLRKELGHYRYNHAVKSAHGSGMEAYLDLFIDSAPDCRARVDSGHRFQDGRVKTLGRIAYEKAFDATFRELVPERDPRKARVD